MNPQRPVLRQVLLFSYFLPPAPVGPAFVVSKILSQLTVEDVSIFTGIVGLDARTYSIQGAAIRYADVPRWWPARDWSRQVGGVQCAVRLRALGNVLVGIACGLWAALIVRRQGLRAVIAVYPKQHFLLAGYVASVLSGRPLIVYFMDVYVEGLSHGGRISRMIERWVVRRATLLFGMSDPHVRQLEERCQQLGRSTTQVVELPHPHINQKGPAVHLKGEPSIVFTGAVYDAQADAIRRLIKAMSRPPLDEENPQLYLYSQSTPEQLASEGISPSDRVHIAHLDSDAVRAAQRGADILFLPIAFDSKFHVRATASPSKLPEYLDTDTPILVHAPVDSYITSYALEHGFAEVVPVASADELAQRVCALARDQARRERVVARAAETLKRHAASSVAKLLQESVEEAIALRPQTSKSPTVVQNINPM